MSIPGFKPPSTFVINDGISKKKPKPQKVVEEEKVVEKKKPILLYEDNLKEILKFDVIAKAKAQAKFSTAAMQDLDAYHGISKSVKDLQWTPGDPNKIVKPNIKEEDFKTRQDEFRHMQQHAVESFFLQNKFTYDGKAAGHYVRATNGQPVGQIVNSHNGAMTVWLFSADFPNAKTLSFELGSPKKIKQEKQDRMLNRFCGKTLIWQADQIFELDENGNKKKHITELEGSVSLPPIGTVIRHPDGSLQINIIRGDPARLGEYKYECFKGIGDEYA